MFTKFRLGDQLNTLVYADIFLTYAALGSRMPRSCYLPQVSFVILLTAIVPSSNIGTFGKYEKRSL